MACAEALRQLGRLTEARETAQTAIRLAPEAAEAHYALALVRAQLGQFAETVAATTEALRLAPWQARYHAFRAQLFFLKGQNAEAVQCADNGLRHDPQHPDCLLWRALAQDARDQPAAADRDFARLLQVAPESSLVHHQLGQVLLRRHQPQSAEPHLTEALRQDPDLAPQLVPLLQQARRQATKPPWLLRDIQWQDQERAYGLEPGFKTILLRLASGLFGLRARWQTRHDPLFKLTRVQRLRRRLWAVLLSMPLAVLALTLYNSPGKFDLDTKFTLNQTAALAALAVLLSVAVQLLKRQIDRESNNF